MKVSHEVVYRDAQVSQVAEKLGLQKVVVEKVILAYVGYLKDRLESGETVKFLNVCYLRYGGKSLENHETLAYVATEVGKQVGVSGVVAFRVLNCYEEFIISDLQKLYSYSIRGLLRISLERNYKDEYKVRIKKSTVYNGEDVYITTLGSFKRKVEG